MLWIYCALSIPGSLQNFAKYLNSVNFLPQEQENAQVNSVNFSPKEITQVDADVWHLVIPEESNVGYFEWTGGSGLLSVVGPEGSSVEISNLSINQEDPRIQTICNVAVTHGLRVRSLGGVTTDFAVLRNAGGNEFFFLDPGECVFISGGVRTGICPELRPGDPKTPWAVRRPVPDEADPIFLNGSALEVQLRLEEQPLVGRCDLSGARTLLLTVHFARVEFLELQAALMQLLYGSRNDTRTIYFVDAYDVISERSSGIVRNMHLQRADARRSLLRRCEELRLCCVAVPLAVHTPCPYSPEHGLSPLLRVRAQVQEPSIRTSSTMQYALDHFGYPFDGNVVLIDGDMVPILPMDYDTALPSHVGLAAVLDTRPNDVEYLYNGYVFLRPRKLPDRFNLEWCCGRQKDVPVDTGGCTMEWIQQPAHRAALQLLREKYSYEIPGKGVGPSFFGPALEMLHYRGGGVWDVLSSDVHNERFKSYTCILLEFLRRRTDIDVSAFQSLLQSRYFSFPWLQNLTCPDLTELLSHTKEEIK